MEPLLAGGLLLAILLAIAGALMWQEAKRGRFSTGPVYVLDDAVSYVHERLPAGTKERLSPADVRRLLEWEIELLQQSDREVRVVGGRRSVRELAHLATRRSQVEYREEDIRRVLEAEIGYLDSIGALAGPAREQTDPDDDSTGR